MTRTSRHIQQVKESIGPYMEAMDTADRQEDGGSCSKSIRLAGKVAELKRQMQRFRDLEVLVQAAPDQQISLTDPDARSMSSSGKGKGIVGYNVQAAVDTRHHLIIAHEVTDLGTDRGQLAPMGRRVQEIVGQSAITVLADRGYYKGEDVKDCIDAGIMPYVPKPSTSGAKADGRFGKQDFAYLPKQDAYRCPAGETMKWWFNRIDENGKELRHYWTTKCTGCPIKVQCTPARMRPITRWEHEGVLDAMQRRLDQVPQAMKLRRQTVDHPFGTLKAWMGSAHFLTKTLKRVSAEMSLQVLAYNMKRVITILGTGPLVAAIRT